MGLDALTWAFKQQLEPAAKLVLLTLADQADPWGHCFPSLSNVSERTGLTAETIRKHIYRLQREHKLVQVIERYRNDGSRTSNAYRLALPSAERTPYELLGGGVVKPDQAPSAQRGGAPSRQTGGPPSPQTGGATYEPSSEPSEEPKTGGVSGFELTAGGEGEEQARIYREAEEVLVFLNERSGRQYPSREPRTHKPTANLELIASRLKAGYTADQCRQVIVRKQATWKDRETREGVKMADYLRPSTLFGPKNFAEYVGELTLPSSEPKRGTK